LGSIREPPSVRSPPRADAAALDEESYYEYGYDDEDAGPASRQNFSNSLQRAAVH